MGADINNTTLSDNNETNSSNCDVNITKGCEEPVAKVYDPIVPLKDIPDMSYTGEEKIIPETEPIEYNPEKTLNKVPNMRPTGLE